MCLFVKNQNYIKSIYQVWGLSMCRSYLTNQYATHVCKMYKLGFEEIAHVKIILLLFSSGQCLRPDDE
jgi:hypothetical protein